jgi:restriction system protein
MTEKISLTTRGFSMDEDREQKEKRETSLPSVQPEETRQREQDQPAPYFLDEHTPNIAAAYYKLASYRRAAILNTTGGSEVFPPFPLVDAAAIPSLLLQTVIVPGARTSEGRLIEAVALPWSEIIALLLKEPAIAHQLTPDKWEEIIAGAYKKAGWDEVILTPRSGDLGRDVIAVKRGVCTIRVIDQVKAYTPPRLVSANDVRALMGVLQTDGASKGCLTTTSDFAPKIKTDPLIVPLIPSRLQLVNRRELFEILERLGRERAT